MTKAAEILVIGDTPTFGRVTTAIIRNADTLCHVRFTTYDQFRGILSPRLLRETDLFILDLWRTYSTGLRAEGLAVIEELSKQRAKAMVVSPLCWGKEVDVPWYWDLGSEDALAQRCQRVLRERVHHSSDGDKQLREWLAAYLAKPEGHDEIP